MISEKLQGKLPELAPDATDIQRSERKAEERQRDFDFIAERLARTADSLNAEEHVAVAGLLKKIFACVAWTNERLDLTKERLDVEIRYVTVVEERVRALEAENAALASRIAALEAAAKPAAAA